MYWQRIKSTDCRAGHGTANVYIKRYSTDEIIKRLVKHDKALLMTDAWYQPKGIQNGAAFYGMVKFLLMAKGRDISLESIIRKDRYCTKNLVQYLFC